MGLSDGLYKVSFQTPLGIGFGVAVLNGGTLLGGDSSIYYVGNYVLDGGTISAEITINEHSAVHGSESVLGTSRATLRLVGTAGDDSARFTGEAREAPGLAFRASLTRLR